LKSVAPNSRNKKGTLSLAPTLECAAQSSGARHGWREFLQRDTKDQPTTYISLLNFSNEQKIIFRNIHSGKRIKVRSETFQIRHFHEMEAQGRAGLVSKWE